MATIDIGKIKPVFKGTYDNSTAYVLDDIVYYNGSSYVAKTSTTGNLPTDTTKWNITTLLVLVEFGIAHFHLAQQEKSYSITLVRQHSNLQINLVVEKFYNAYSKVQVEHQTVDFNEHLQ